MVLRVGGTNGLLSVPQYILVINVVTLVCRLIQIWIHIDPSLILVQGRKRLRATHAAVVAGCGLPRLLLAGSHLHDLVEALGRNIRRRSLAIDLDHLGLWLIV